MVIYDPRGMTWDEWCKLTCERFATQQLQPVPESAWRDWASRLLDYGVFVAEGVPDARGFRDWRDWAFCFAGAMGTMRGNAA